MKTSKTIHLVRILDAFCRVSLLAFYLALAVAALVCAPRGLCEAFFHNYEADMRMPVSDFGLGHFRFIQAHLEEPFEDYTEAQTLIIPFKAVALSNMATGMMNLSVAKPEMKAEIAPLIAEVVRRALLPKVSIYGFDPREVRELGNEGMYLSHLNMILGCYLHITGDDRYDSLHVRISRHLAEMALRDSDFTAPSFGGANKWPADHTVLLCSLYLFDRTHGTDISKAPIDGWLAYMKDHGTDTLTGLPFSEITNMTHGRLPRGCALSWSAFYMAQFAPVEALGLYTRYRNTYFEQMLGLGGFREWPPGIDLDGNIDAGPVVFGIGLSASGIGVGTARLFRDRRTYVTLMRTAAVVGMPRYVDSGREYWTAPFLGEAMLFNGQTATSWFGNIPSPGFSEPPGFPFGAVVFLVVELLLLFIAVYRIGKLLRFPRAST